MSSNNEHIFNDFANVRLAEDISASDVSITLVEGFVRQLEEGWSSGEEFYITLVDSAGNREVVKVTGISGNTLTVTRAQDGTSARAWYAGTLINQRLVADSIGEFWQKAAHRSIDYNPHGLLSAAFPGEKALQTGAQACHNRWWKNVGGTNWRLIAGTICANEYKNGDGYVFEYPTMKVFGGLQVGITYLVDNDEYDPDTWTSKADLPLPARHRHAGTTILSKAYAIDGDAGYYLGDNDEYQSDAWTSRADDPYGGSKRYAVAITLYDEGYRIGGYTGSYLRRNDKYTPPTDTWSVKTQMPTPTRENLAAIELEPYGYVFGGRTTGTSIPDTDEYDGVFDTWDSKTDVPYGSTGVRGLTAVPLLGIGYVFGGIDQGNTRLRDAQSYDPDTWTSKTDMPLPARNQPASNVYSDIAYLFGGEDGDFSYINDTDEYDPDTWTSKTNMAKNHGSAASASST
jgi:hypothetical protein